MAKAEKTTVKGTGVSSSRPPDASLVPPADVGPTPPQMAASTVKDTAARSAGSGSQAVLPSDERVLIHRAGSALMFVDVKKVVKVEMPGGGYSAVVEPEGVPIHFDSTPIEGCPEAAGGSSAVLGPKMAEQCYPADYAEDPKKALRKLWDHFERHDRYGMDIAFLDDKDALEPVLQRMVRQAAKYDSDFREAVASGIMRSDAVLPEDRVYA